MRPSEQVTDCLSNHLALIRLLPFAPLSTARHMLHTVGHTRSWSPIRRRFVMMSTPDRFHKRPDDYDHQSSCVDSRETRGAGSGHWPGSGLAPEVGPRNA